jgi:hypothetical protein
VAVNSGFWSRGRRGRYSNFNLEVYRLFKVAAVLVGHHPITPISSWDGRCLHSDADVDHPSRQYFSTHGDLLGRAKGITAVIAEKVSSRPGGGTCIFQAPAHGKGLAGCKDGVICN